MNKTKWILIFLLPVQWLSIHLIKNQSLWIEQIYSQKVYPLLFKLQRFFVSALPFSFGELAYGLSVVYIVWNLVQLFKRKLKARTLIVNTIAVASLLSLCFHLLWGLNYYRIPLNEKLNYNLEYNEDQLEKTLKSIIESTNKLHQSLTPSDSVAVQIPYSKMEIKEQLQSNFHFKLADFKTQPYLKNSLWSTVLSYMGFAGYLNPLTLESQVNRKTPKLNLQADERLVLSRDFNLFYTPKAEPEVAGVKELTASLDNFVNDAGKKMVISKEYEEKEKNVAQA